MRHGCTSCVSVKNRALTRLLWENPHPSQTPLRDGGRKGKSENKGLTSASANAAPAGRELQAGAIRARACKHDRGRKQKFEVYARKNPTLRAQSSRELPSFVRVNRMGHPEAKAEPLTSQDSLSARRMGHPQGRIRKQIAGSAEPSGDAKAKNAAHPAVRAQQAAPLRERKAENRQQAREGLKDRTSRFLVAWPACGRQAPRNDNASLPLRKIPTLRAQSSRALRMGHPKRQKQARRPLNCRRARDRRASGRRRRDS